MLLWIANGYEFNRQTPLVLYNSLPTVEWKGTYVAKFWLKKLIRLSKGMGSMSI